MSLALAYIDDGTGSTTPPPSFPAGTLPLSLTPLRDSGGRKIEDKSVRVQYGDGYLHSRPVGINSRILVVPVAFIVDTVGRATLLAFLESVGTHAPFTAALPGWPTQGYLIEGEVSEEIVGDVWRYSMSFRTYYGAIA